MLFWLVGCTQTQSSVYRLFIFGLRPPFPLSTPWWTHPLDRQTKEKPIATGAGGQGSTQVSHSYFCIFISTRFTSSTSLSDLFFVCRLYFLFRLFFFWILLCVLFTRQSVRRDVSSLDHSGLGQRLSPTNQTPRCQAVLLSAAYALSPSPTLICLFNTLSQIIS